jgi:hypothetical protein
MLCIQKKKDIMKLFVEETGVPVKTTDLPQFTDKHNVVSSTPHLNRIRTHNVSGDKQ